jgi:hypothetical protein
MVDRSGSAPDPPTRPRDSPRAISTYIHRQSVELRFRQVHWLDAVSDDLLKRPWVLDGFTSCSYAGLAPVTRRSGKSINGESKCRRGIHRAEERQILTIAFASRRAPESKTFTTANGQRAKSTTRRPSASPGPDATSS